MAEGDNPNNPGEFKMQAQQEALCRPYTYEDFYAILGKYPYIEVSHLEATHYPTTAPKIIESSVGWKIHYYDQLIASSQSELLTLLLTGVDLSDAGIESKILRDQQALKQKLIAEAKGEAVEIPTPATSDKRSNGTMNPVGTPVNQFFNTALDIVKLAKHSDWPGLRVVRGYYPMQRAIWISCENLGLRCDGFDPTPEDHVVYSWVKSLSSDTFERMKKRPMNIR